VDLTRVEPSAVEEFETNEINCKQSLSVHVYRVSCNRKDGHSEDVCFSEALEIIFIVAKAMLYGPRLAQQEWLPIDDLYLLNNSSFICT
jgi:hypothetical protein